MFRKMLYSLLDPAIWLIPMLASTLTFSYDTNLFLYSSLSIIFLWLGFYSVNGNPTRRNFAPVKVTNILTLKIYTYIICILYLVSNSYIFISKGIPLLSDVPTEDKISVFEGNGLLRRISFLGNIIPINLILLICISKRNNKTNICLLIIYSIFKLLLGSKGSIVGLIFPLYYFITQKNLFKIHLNFKKYTKYFIVIGLIALSAIFSIVSRESEAEGGNIWYSLGFRLMEFGDVMLYYSSNVVQDAFNNKNILNFVPDELNGILGMLRLTPYNEPLGFLMVKAFNRMNFDTVTGPNTLFLVKGHIYFGFIGGLLYSYCCGFLFTKLRQYFFQMQIRDIFWYSMVAYAFFNCMGLLRESSGFISNLFDYCFYTFPILFISEIISRLYGKKTSNIKTTLCHEI